MRKTNAILAAVIVLICGGLGAMTPQSGVTIQIIFFLVFFIGCLIPAWMWWISYLNESDESNGRPDSKD